MITSDVVVALKKLEGKEYCFDTIFMDPPYNNGYEEQVLRYLGTSSLLHNETLIVVEASLETDFSYVESLGFCIEKSKEYKTNQHVFLKKITE